MIQRSVGKLVDTLLRHFQPIGHADLLAYNLSNSSYELITTLLIHLMFKNLL